MLNSISLIWKRIRKWFEPYPKRVGKQKLKSELAQRLLQDPEAARQLRMCMHGKRRTVEFEGNTYLINAKEIQA